MILFFTFILMSRISAAQSKKWGDIDLKTLKETVYAPDSSAAAVVLFDKGNLRIEDNLQYFLDRHVRIKLIRPEGYRWATVELDYNKDYEQEIEELEAATYTLEGKGKIKEHEVDKDSFFDEKIISDWNRITFTFPSLEPGCIIEYRYTFKIGDPSYLPVWYFDWTIPTKWNQLVAEFPGFLNFTKVLSGVEELDINEWKEFNKTIRVTYKTNDRSLYSLATGREREGRVNFNGERFTWVLKDREGIPDLPYMTNRDDYRAHIRFQLSEFNIPDEVQEDYFKSWHNVILHWLEDDEFSSFLNANAQYEKIISSLPLQSKSAIEQVRVLFDYVTSTYNPDNSYGLFKENSFDDIITSQNGSGAELNLLLAGLLRQAGVRAYPVLVSTRDHGTAFTKYVLPNQFNHLIVLVKLEDHDLLLDGSMGNRPLYLLPENDLNGKGLVLQRSDPGNEKWTSLVPLQNTIRAASLQAKINPDGTLDGKISGVSTGYFAFEDRKKIEEKGREAFIGETLFKHFADYHLSGFDIAKATDLDSTLDYRVHLNSGLAKGTQVVDSTIYLDTTPVMKWVENPLKQNERKYPVDFPYSYGEQLTIVYHIPEGYEIEEYPDRLVSRIPKDGGVFSRIVQIKDRSIIIRSYLDLGRSRYSASEYNRLKLFLVRLLRLTRKK